MVRDHSPCLCITRMAMSLKGHLEVSATVSPPGARVLCSLRPHPAATAGGWPPINFVCSAPQLLLLLYLLCRPFFFPSAAHRGRSSVGPAAAAGLLTTVHPTDAGRTCRSRGPEAVGQQQRTASCWRRVVWHGRSATRWPCCCCCCAAWAPGRVLLLVVAATQLLPGLLLLLRTHALLLLCGSRAVVAADAAATVHPAAVACLQPCCLAGISCTPWPAHSSRSRPAASM